MPSYTVTLTDAEDKALSVIAISQQEWIDNAVKNRCRISKEEIVASEIKRIRESGGTVSGTDDEIVMAATVETAAERNTRLQSELP
jgi:aspartyl aminopeptidase